MARKKLQGQVAIVTGGGRGLGAATAEQLAQAGASVVVTARSADQVEAVVARLREQGARAIGVPADVADPEQVEEVVESALDQFNRVDILVNNAGIIWPVEEVAETDGDEWAYNIHVNLLGPFYLTRTVLPVMIDQHYGHVVNISSGAASSPTPGMSAYCVAKAGLDMLTKVMGLELTGTGVTVNTLYPGQIDTDMQADIRSIDTSESRLDLSRWHDVFEQGKLISPEHAARLILWLAGPWSRQHNGVTFHSDDPAWVAQVSADLGV